MDSIFRGLAVLVLTAAGVLSLTLQPWAEQRQGGTVPSRRAYKAPRAPDGKADLNGI